MFDNIGSKVMRLAMVSAIIGIVASIISAIVEWVAGLVFAGFLTLILGCLGSWIGSWALYAIGYIAQNSELTRQEMAELKSQLQPSSNVPSSPKSAAAGIRCPHCGYTNPTYYSTCKDCGKALSRPRPVAASAYSAPIAQTPKKTCPSCGARNNLGNTECFACNAKLPE